MEIRDPVHGQIDILDEEIPIIEDPFFLRLRKVKQLGLSEYIFPGATHTRFLHSLGVMKIAERVFDKLSTRSFCKSMSKGSCKFSRIRETFKLAALLHDLGHAPLSHSTESVMPPLSLLKIPNHTGAHARQATHEDYAIKIIVDSSFTDSLKKVKKKFDVNANAIANLISGKCSDPEYFELKKGINYFPLLHQLISSEIDCDRMDYLLRDSYFCGVSYGHFDIEWIIDNLDVCILDCKEHKKGHKEVYLGINERAVSSFDDFLLGRFHMFLMVYFHYRAVCLEQLLSKFFKTSPAEYVIPSDIEEYQKHDDFFLNEVLKNSQNTYAQKIIKNIIPPKIFESFHKNELGVLLELEKFLQQKEIEYIRCSSQGRLSKYYHLENQEEKYYPLKVVKILPQGKKFINIDEATDLFKKFSDVHRIERIHCDLKQLSAGEKKKILSIINGVSIQAMR
ncbi:MAG: HD domain-containing protein [Oligoflexia bacterium]|nr:HD domain-containing protein [Oligoflexia bacterium]